MKLYFKTLFMVGIVCWVVSCDSEDSLWNEPGSSAGFSFNRQNEAGIDPNFMELTSEDAVRVSDLFMRQENISATSRSVFSTRTSSETLPIKSSGGEVVAYAVNYAPTGFAVISATKKYSPILAFSDEGQITQSAIDNSGLGWWVSRISDDIVKAESEIKENTPEYAEVRSEWREYEKKEDMVVRSPEVGSGYYWFLQLRDQMMSTCGMAEIDRRNFSYMASQYGHNYSNGDEDTFRELDRLLAISYANNPPVPPSFVWGEGFVGQPTETKVMPLLSTYWDQGTPYNLLLPFIDGSLEEHWPSGCVTIATSQIMNYHSYPNVIDGVTIDWSQTQKMFASEQDVEIQRLVKVVNLGVETTPEGASNINKAQAFLCRNGYLTNIYDSNIEEILSNEIKSNRPVYLRGQDESVGHAWVCDGYYEKKQ